MDSMNQLRAAFEQVMMTFNSSTEIKRLISGNLTVAHYKSYLKQTFHYTRENPQLQVLAATHFKGSDRDVVQRYFRHAISEVGHDHLALSDLSHLGDDTTSIPFENPLPGTAALNAFAYQQILHRNPIGHLGYMFFLEFLPTSSGSAYIDALKRAGVPAAAMTFIEEHSTVDVGHNRLMEEYAKTLIHNDNDLAAVIYAMRVTGRLFARMVEDAFEQAERPVDWGCCHSEIDRTNSKYPQKTTST